MKKYQKNTGGPIVLGPTVRPQKVANWAPDSRAPGPSCPGPDCPLSKSGKLGPGIVLKRGIF